jgi:hypothetical protein
MSREKMGEERRKKREERRKVMLETVRKCPFSRGELLPDSAPLIAIHYCDLFQFQ